MKYLMLVLVCCISAATASFTAVTATEQGDQIVLDNGTIQLTFSKKRMDVESIFYRHDGLQTEMGGGSRSLYFDVNADSLDPGLSHETGPKAGYQSLGEICNSAKIGQNDGTLAEVIFSGSPVKWFPFDTEAHVVLRAGESGFYAYTIFRHGNGMPAGTITQCRFVMRGPPDDSLYTNHIVDDKRMGPFPTAKQVETLQDATYRLADGTVYTKYNNTAFTADDLVHGMAGHAVGAWLIWPSHEFLNGGPLRQDLTVHMDNVLLAMYQSAHFGAASVQVEKDQQWTHFYGPAFFYLNNGPSIPDMWANAQQTAAQIRAAWPFDWIHNPDYPLERGTVTGTVKLTDGNSTTGAWAILAPPDHVDWALSSNGYMFWTRVNADGHFEIKKVRPGTYDLFISGANQFEDFKRSNITVKADAATDLGALDWTPITHGQQLWQIGVADRSSQEFFDGDNVRHYGNFLRYSQNFPQDVTFTIGQSIESKDWNFAQWSWYSSKPHWTIRFNLPQALHGKAILTLGLAAVDLAGDLIVRVNDKEVAHQHLKKSGAAAYRSGGQDSVYTLCYVPFDASLLVAGMNQITLGDSRAVPLSAPEDVRRKAFGAVMYDAIRLEIQR